jgi:molybdate transport system regulatory protein
MADGTSRFFAWTSIGRYAVVPTRKDTGPPMTNAGSHRPAASHHARILSAPTVGRWLDPIQLNRLEQALRAWSHSSRRPDLGVSRRRILLIYLLIRYTGARLNEVLGLDIDKDVNFETHSVRFQKAGGAGAEGTRDVQIPEGVAAEIRNALGLLSPRPASGGRLLALDPAHVRRKFYERAEAAGLPRELGAPEVIRRSRAVELMQGNVPLPVVQKILGHATPGLAAAYVTFSEEDLSRAEAFFIARENRRRTSARNSFFGKIERIHAGDVQALVEIVTLGEIRIRCVITGHSLTRLGLREGGVIAAEVKAPWVTMHRGDEPACTAENRLPGTVVRVARGRIASEVVVRIADGTEICAVITEESRRALKLKPGESVWAAFNAFAVVLHTD